MATRAVDERSSRPLLTLGTVHQVRVQVGYRARPDGPVYEQFLVDLPIPEPDRFPDRDAFSESQVLAVLEPVIYAGVGAPMHYSLHVHRSHTTWGLSPGALEVGLLVTTGTRAAASAEARREDVSGAIHALLELTGRPEPTPTSRDAAVVRARRSAATAYDLDPDVLWLSAEEHHAAANSWTVLLRTAAGDEYDVVVGLVDGYAGSVRVRHGERIEVSDSVGSE